MTCAQAGQLSYFCHVWHLLAYLEDRFIHWSDGMTSYKIFAGYRGAERRSDKTKRLQDAQRATDDWISREAVRWRNERRIKHIGEVVAQITGGAK
jgi:hypothetical protein